ncbi:hypothetical protein IST455A_05550 [Burkholderia multivorans]|nr:hypothetical protein IST455A_05550 [Burkholderia multivorans]CAB5281177.1 hypothetical protein IST495B_05556 [Burkholderia multivorans]CAB5283154.1 hypothetical protein IST455B_05551 [Burkholderia multivorans]CAB5327640.1 hypothetical protein IST453_05572 [Burkholderia multivorans]
MRRASVAIARPSRFAFVNTFGIRWRQRKKRGGAGRFASSGAAARRVANGVQYTGCPLIRLGSQVEKNGRYVTMLIALKIAM